MNTCRTRLLLVLLFVTPLFLQGCPRLTVVPPVVGLTQSAATAAVEAAGFVRGSVTEAFSSTVAEGIVISQSPAAGTSATAGSSVSFVVSKGPETLVVPDVVGLEQSAAEAALVAAGLTAGTVTEAFSDSVDLGDVISQNPAAGAEVETGSAVALVVSKGPEPAVVPNVVGLEQSAAGEALVSAGFTLGVVTEAFSDTIVAGSVISQNPAAGAEADAGSAVALVVSMGSERVTVPNVVGLTQPAAGTSLVAERLTVGAVTQAFSETVVLGAVISQNPAAGAEVDAGSAVAIVVSRGPERLPVPVVVGLTQSAAETELVAGRFTVGEIAESFSETVALGSVISQKPASGVRVAPGTAVDLVISLGPAPRIVPDVVGLSQTDAEAALLDEVLAVGTITEELSETVALGDVISQDPVADTEVARDSAVNLVVSLGPAPRIVPDVVGLTQSAAEAALLDVVLTVGTITEEFSDTVDLGAVISQDPAADTEVARDSAVNLVVSLGPETRIVPDVVGLSQTDAETALIDAELAVGTITGELSETVALGDVISQDPTAETEVPRDTAVNLVISLGPARTVPNVVGLSQTDAESALLEADLAAGTITEELNETVALGDVISQNPAADTEVARDSAVDLVISLGPAPVTVPDVVGIGQFEAGFVLSAAGLTAGTVIEEFSETVASGNVISQDPAADTEVPRDTPVDLVISLGSSEGFVELLSPVGVATDSAGNVYVSDSGNSRIVKLTNDLEPIAVWGQLGAEPGEFDNNMGIAVDADDNVYVVDAFNVRVQKFDSSGGFLLEFGGGDMPVLGLPQGVAAAPDGSIYVTDAALYQVHQFTSEGELIQSFGSEGSEDGQFEYPLGVAVNSAGDVFVSDATLDRVQQFTGTGDFIAELGADLFCSPSGIVFNSLGEAFVTDSCTNNVLSFAPDGSPDGDFGSFGFTAGLLDRPAGIAADTNDNLFVADMGNRRVQKFAANGEFIGESDIAVLPGPDSYEPDNGPDEASSIAAGDFQVRNFHVPEDVDWVAFEIRLPSMATIQVGWDFSLPVITLLDSDLNVLASDDDQDGLIVYDFTSRGTYFLEIAPLSDSETGLHSDYYLELLVPDKPDAFEPDNVSGDASSIEAGDVQSRNFHTPDDVDWVSIVIVDPVILSMSALNIGPRADTTLTLFDSGLSELDFNDHFNPRIVFSFDTPGTYFLLVAPYAGVAEPLGTSYKLSVAEAVPDAPDAFEPDDVPGDASPIAAGESQSRNFHVPGDIDWVAIEIVDPVVLSMSVRNVGTLADTVLTLLDSTQTELQSNDNFNPRIDYSFDTPGTYYLLVEPFGGMAELVDTEYELSVDEVIPDAPDAFEPDDTSDDASVIDIGGFQSHNFHLPGDRDWVAIEVLEPVTLTMSTLNLGGLADTTMTLLDSTLTELDFNDDFDGLASRIDFSFETPGTYYLLIQPFGGSASIPGSTYDLEVAEFTGIMAPSSDSPRANAKHSKLNRRGLGKGAHVR